MHTRSSSRRTPRLAAALLALFVALAPSAALAQSDSELDSDKAYWQDRYRRLLNSADALRAEIERETELYADANRRNYRRGKKRHVHRVAAEEAREKLAEVERELATIKEDGRRAGALPGWFYEVELDRADAARNPALVVEPEDPAAGRNPRFLEDEKAPPASRR